MSNESALLLQAASFDQSSDLIENALTFVREHLDMEVAYLSEFVGDDMVFRSLSAPGFEDVVSVGSSIPLDQVYCRHILAGRLPELIPDTANEPFAQDIPITKELPIGSHISVPVRRSDGTPYGMFCCLSRQPQPSLNERDLQVMRAFANLSAEQINSVLAERSDTAERRALIEHMLTSEDVSVVYQPIFCTASRRPKGFEALARFQSDPYRPPNLWFDDAASVGLQADLEVRVIEMALQALQHLPDEIYISVNASPQTVAMGVLSDVTARHQPERIVLEVTEHAEVKDYQALNEALDVLRFQGVRIAIDDAGAGYSGLQHIVRLRPELLKLDISLTSGMDSDIVKRSLASALVNFATETRAKIVAEGIETEDEFATLKELGIELGQGFLLGKPASLEDAQAWFGQEKSRKTVA